MLQEVKKDWAGSHAMDMEKEYLEFEKENRKEIGRKKRKRVVEEEDPVEYELGFDASIFGENLANL